MKKKMYFLLAIIASFSIFGCDTPNKSNEKTSIKIKKEEKLSALFNFETKKVTLNSGYEMPMNGIGTYSLLDKECESVLVMPLIKEFGLSIQLTCITMKKRLEMQ